MSNAVSESVERLGIFFVKCRRLEIFGIFRVAQKDVVNRKIQKSRDLFFQPKGVPVINRHQIAKPLMHDFLHDDFFVFVKREKENIKVDDAVMHRRRRSSLVISLKSVVVDILK